MASMKLSLLRVPLITVLMLALLAQQTSATRTKTHYYDWKITNKTLTRNCHTVTVATVNGMFPGPPVEVHEGDRVIVKVTNKQVYPVTMHWHGIKQLRTNYADGPAYITQCPIVTGGSQIYEFTVENQRGTFWYHAHIHWLRATVHGALIVHPRKKQPRTYHRVHQEIPIVIGEWFGMPANEYRKGFLNTPAPRENATSVTPTINGWPGPMYNCSNGAETFKVHGGKTYLLRIINAAMNNDYWFSVANHELTVVGADGNYLVPFTTKYLPIQPGQTTDVLVTMSENPGKYYFGVMVGPVPLRGFPPPRIPALAMFQYRRFSPSASAIVPEFPDNVTLVPVNEYNSKLKAYGSSITALPKRVDVDLIYTIGIAWVDCIAPEPCVQKLMGMVQNITFEEPHGTTILEAYLRGANGVYQTGFPDKAPLPVSLTAPDFRYRNGTRGTQVKMLNFGDHVRLVFQNVFAAGILDHPIHLHGHDFHVIGSGYGVYNPAVHPKSFNLVDPPVYNTFGVPNGGWLAIQFHANNPGVWFMHCHFERHLTWGMSMVFITKNGRAKDERLPAALRPLPRCTP